MNDRRFMNTISKLWKYRSFLQYIFQSIYFNFHYLPVRQAVKLPILVHKMKIVAAKGQVEIDAADVRTGMIQLGVNMVSLYPDRGIVWDQHGGKVVFHGECLIGGDSAVSFGKNTVVEFGDRFCASASWKCVSYRGIVFGDRTRFGWNTMIMDTNFHALYDMEKKQFRRASGKIVIGPDNWFSTDCRILHSTVTPEHCVFAMGTIVTPGCAKEPYCVMGGSPVRILRRNVMRILGENHEEE